MVWWAKLESHVHCLTWWTWSSALVSSMQLEYAKFLKGKHSCSNQKKVKWMLGSQISRGSRHNQNVVVKHQEVETKSDRWILKYTLTMAQIMMKPAKRLIKPGSKSSLNQAVNFDFPLKCFQQCPNPEWHMSHWSTKHLFPVSVTYLLLILLLILPWPPSSFVFTQIWSPRLFLQQPLCLVWKIN